MLKHGRESLVEMEQGGKSVSKKPLPGRSLAQKREWLARQQRAIETIDKLNEIGNNAYGVPHIKFVDTARYNIVEERVDGVPLTPLLFHTLNQSEREKVIDSLAQFYADMHSINMIPNPIQYTMNYGLNTPYLEIFIEEDIRKYFPKSEIKFISKFYQKIMNVSYETRLVFVHGDLFEENVLYNPKLQKFSVIDFTDAAPSFLHYDMLRSYTNDLGVVNEVRKKYIKYRKSGDLPRDFTDDTRWAEIKAFHDAAELLEQMNETVSDFQYSDQANQGQKLKQIKKQIELLHKYDR